jgi:peroxiredoxin
VLKLGDPAPDFAVGDRRLSSVLKQSGAVVFFFPKAFTPG